MVLTFLAYFLIFAAVAPLVLLGLAVLADALGFKAGMRMLDGVIALLVLQGAVGGLLNLVGGAALAALGVWGLSRMEGWPGMLGAAALVPFGAWRSWRGLLLLKALWAERRGG